MCIRDSVLRGVGQAAVDVAGICQTKAVCCVLAVAEHLGSGLIDRHCKGIGCGIGPVSYTHLDVYKRQEEILAAKVVDPGQGRLRGGDDIFFACVIKMRCV